MAQLELAEDGTGSPTRSSFMKALEMRSVTDEF
jgi:hypothetical protein